jgi:hypothetical protein
MKKKDWVLKEHDSFSQAIKELFDIDEEQIFKQIKEVYANMAHVIMSDTKTESGYNLLTKVLGIEEEVFKDNAEVFIRACELAYIVLRLYKMALKSRGICERFFVPVPAIFDAVDEEDTPSSMFM